MNAIEKKKMIDKRVKALETLELFSKFLRAGVGLNGRGVLSPQRALEHLKNRDVRELLGMDRVGEIRRACEMLA